MWIPEEKRTALADVRVACRIVGFGEDNSDQEQKGYHVYIPELNAFEWSNDVLIDNETPMTPLNNEQSAVFSDIDNILQILPMMIPPAILILKMQAMMMTFFPLLMILKSKSNSRLNKSMSNSSNTF